MGYIDQTLDPGEVIVYRTKLHWSSFIGPACLVLVTLPIWIGTSSTAAESFLAVALIIGAISYASYTHAEFGVTNRRVILKTGVIRRRVIELLLHQVEGISVDQGMIDRTFGSGTVVVSGTGGTRERFSSVANPFAFRSAVQAQAQAHGRLEARQANALPPDRLANGVTSDEKQCPDCAETVKAAARVCRYCGYRFQPVAR